MLPRKMRINEMLRMWNDSVISSRMCVTKHQDMIPSYSLGILMQKLENNIQIKA